MTQAVPAETSRVNTFSVLPLSVCHRASFTSSVLQMGLSPRSMTRAAAPDMAPPTGS